jgi:hypothetical protein
MIQQEDSTSQIKQESEAGRLSASLGTEAWGIAVQERGQRLPDLWAVDLAPCISASFQERDKESS